MLPARKRYSIHKILILQAASAHFFSKAVNLRIMVPKAFLNRLYSYSLCFQTAMRVLSAYYGRILSEAATIRIQRWNI